jgi:hypothetical protein
LFDELAERPEQQDLRYVLTLLLIRRRVLKLDVPSESLTGQSEKDVQPDRMMVYCPKRGAAYDVHVDMPDQARIDEIQQQLSELLIADAD